MKDNLTITKREAIFLLVAAFIGIISVAIPNSLRIALEIPMLCFIGAPLVIYLITDPERMKK